jgi:integrase
MEGARYFEDGRLVIFRRSGNVFSARIRIAVSPVKYIWRSLGTTDVEKAISIGRKLLFQLEHRAEQGLPQKSKLFSAVIDDYIAFRERDHVQGRTTEGMLKQIIRVAKFWRVYAGALPIEAIDDKVMRAFIPWRRYYYSNFTKLPKNAKLHPKDTTLQWEMMLGKAIIRWAHEQGVRGQLALPTATFTAKKKRARPAFEIPEYRQLWRTMRKRINEAEDGRIRRSREFLRDYVLVLANSGMRVGEANNLKIRDVMPFRDAKGRNNFRFIVRGKTGERDVILRSAAARRLDKILTKRTGDDPNDFLFAMPKGTRIISLNDQFNMALRRAELVNNGAGEKYSLYSLRHFYAVTALRNGIGVFEVARNMGTSVQMIQQYYGKQATASVFATRLGD